MAERIVDPFSHPLATIVDAGETSSASDTAASTVAGATGTSTTQFSSPPPPPQHAYRLPELTDAMRQTVSYGGCAVSPMATQYQRIDVDDGDGLALGMTMGISMGMSSGETSSSKIFRKTSESRLLGEERLSSSSSRLFQGNDAFNGKTGRPHTLILRFDTSGNGTFQQMSRLDVLRLTQEAAKPKPMARTVEEDYDHSDDDNDTGVPQRSGAGRARLQRRNSRRFSIGGGGGTTATAGGGGEYSKPIDVQRVHARDIRKLDHAFAVSNEPSIVVRRQAILMNADPLRAVIMRDACLVFVPDGADSLLATLKTKFREHTQLYGSGSDAMAAMPATSSAGGYHAELPFEMRALEALLATVCRYFEYDYEKTAPVVTSALDRLAHGRTIPTGELEKLRAFKNTMNEFESQVDGVRRALVEILDDEEALRLLHLSKLHDDPSLLSDLYSFDSEDVEVLVENYLQDIFSTRTKATLLQHRIQNTESLVMLKLDSMRNYLLGVDLIFSLVAISISVGTYVTGAFGMNLNSHLQEEDGWFWGVLLFTLIVFIVFTVSGVVFFRQKGVLL